MIILNFNITNPFSDRFTTITTNSGRFTKHKAWEFEILKVNCILNFNVVFNTHCDHAGLKIEFGLLGYEMYFQIYDTRHWDYKNKTWIDYE